MGVSDTAILQGSCGGKVDRPQPGSYGPTSGLFAKEPKSPCRQPSAEQAKECSSDKDDKYCPYFHPLIVDKLKLGRLKPNVFVFQGTSPTPGDDKPMQYTV